jgi:hypothetical protein
MHSATAASSGARPFSALALGIAALAYRQVHVDRVRVDRQVDRGLQLAGVGHAAPGGVADPFDDAAAFGLAR